MITIKIKTEQEVKIPESCDDCLFVIENDAMDYGEFLGYCDYYCPFLNKHVGVSFEPNTKPENCPIISIEKED